MKIKTAIMSPVSILLIAIVAIALVLVAFSTPAANSDLAAEEKQQPAQTAEEEPKETEESDVSYNYVAQPGDSYTKLARKAVQTYGLKHDVALSDGQIVYAESNLTIEAGSPALEIDEAVSFSEATVKSWVEKAQGLNEERKAAWDVLATTVEFNTDNVGEKRE